MKSAEQIRQALATYEADMKRIQTDLANVKTVWKKAGEVMEHPEFLVACVKEREALEKEEEKTSFKIRFAKWVLEE